MTTKIAQTIASPWLTPVRVISLSNISGTYYNGINNDGVGASITIAASSLTIDSVVMKVGDRLLLSAQDLSYENGIYIILRIDTLVLLQRASDQQSIDQYLIGQYVSVGAGTLSAGNTYTVIEPLPNHLGIDSLTFNPTASGGGGGAIVLPTIASRIATYTDTIGTLSEDANPAVNAGDIQAGVSGISGAFISYPSDPLNGSLRFQANNNLNGNFTTTITTGFGVGQDQTIYIPDIMFTVASFIVSNVGGFPQYINGGIVITAGDILAPDANIIAGSVGAAGKLTSTASVSGTLSLKAANNSSGDKQLNIINASSIGQDTDYTLGDPGQSSCNIIVGTSSFTTGNLVKASGSSILIDSGISASSVSPIGKIVYIDFDIQAASLAVGASQYIINIIAGQSYKIRSFFVNAGSGLSGGGGNRNIALKDSFGNYLIIGSALIQTPINTLWGSTGIAFDTAAQNRTSVVSAGLFFVYSGGTTDYAAGTLNVTMAYERVT